MAIKPHAYLDFVSQLDLDIFGIVIDLSEDICQALSGPGQHLVYNCHVICHVLASQDNRLTRVDGRYMGHASHVDMDELRAAGGSDPKMTVVSASHSWLLTPDGAIIDPYPVGMIVTGPVMIPKDCDYCPFGWNMYARDSEVTNGLAQVPEVMDSVREIQEALAEYYRSRQSWGEYA